MGRFNMALRLRVVSPQRRSLGERSSIVFGVGGGTIGRAADNDWVLPDPLRYVSSCHARVHFRKGQWLIEDLSTNGAYVNDQSRPIGKHATHVLANGDLIRLGEYELLVALDGATDFPPTDNARVALDVLGVHRADPAATDGDIGASINMASLLGADPAPSDSFRAVNAFGQAVATPLDPLHDSNIARQAEAEKVSRRMERLARAARAREAVQPAALFDVQSGLAAFCRGAGIDPDRLPTDAQTRMLHLAGQMFREALLGLKDLSRHHHEVRNNYRIELPSSAADEPFPLDRGAVDDLVTSVLASHDSRRIDAVQWLRERFEDARGHEKAAGIALRAAFIEFIDRLDPSELESRFDRALKKNRPTGSQRAQYWDLYADFYRNITEMPDNQLPHVFVEAFARAYAEARKPGKPSGG
ncbi:MAG: hypothetical protein CMLOHMNK_00041 [Steroidobacteraceae bacterium]|nr:hypothetical protein [Steroidobacteraceae bacterium]